MVKTIGFGVLAGALLSQPATALDAQKEGGLDGLIAQHAKSNGVPADLVHRVIKRESRYNPRAVGRGGAMGLMQIKHGTARALGYAGTPAGLLSAETNLTYGVRYLAGAYKVANGDPNRAVAFFARGYYYDAKRKGMLASLASGKAQPVQAEAEAAVPDVQADGVDRLLDVCAGAVEPHARSEVAAHQRCSKASSTPFARAGGA